MNGILHTYYQNIRINYINTGHWNFVTQFINVEKMLYMNFWGFSIKRNSLEISIHTFLHIFGPLYKNKDKPTYIYLIAQHWTRVQLPVFGFLCNNCSWLSLTLKGVSKFSWLKHIYTGTHVFFLWKKNSKQIKIVYEILFINSLSYGPCILLIKEHVY